MLVKHRKARRAVGGSLVVIGGVLMWLAPEDALPGVILLVSGIVIELLGIALEHRSGDPSGRLSQE